MFCPIKVFEVSSNKGFKKSNFIPLVSITNWLFKSPSCNIITLSFLGSSPVVSQSSPISVMSLKYSGIVFKF